MSSRVWGITGCSMAAGSGRRLRHGLRRLSELISGSKGSMFFFEKKEPKNSCTLGYVARQADTPKCKSLLLLFFRKEDLP
jgi:hypothetical protein